MSEAPGNGTTNAGAAYVATEVISDPQRQIGARNVTRICAGVGTRASTVKKAAKQLRLPLESYGSREKLRLP